jgi:hypothetical protein
MVEAHFDSPTHAFTLFGHQARIYTGLAALALHLVVVVATAVTELVRPGEGAPAFTVE